MPRHPLCGAAAIVGLGITAQGKVYGQSAIDFAVEAVSLALADAGLERGDLDGVLLNPGLAWQDFGMGSFQLQQAMGLRNLRLSATMNLGGATAGAMIQHAAEAVASGRARAVACVFSDATLKPPRPSGERASSGSAYGFSRGWEAAYGFFGVNAMYALVAQRHMHRFGTTQDHLGAVAVAQRKWANLNPQAQLHDQALTLAEYHASRWVVEPFHLYDCCLVSNGGLAVIVTAADRARDLRRPPVYVRGMAQGHLGGDPLETLSSGAVLSAGPAFRMAGLTLADVDVAQLYDCYTFTVVVCLEDYGFCAKGEGGPYAAEHLTGPGGLLAVNTGGGQLSSFYMWGMTPVSEAIIQLRGDGGGRQVAKHDVALVSGNGGVLSTHSTLLLRPRGGIVSGEAAAKPLPQISAEMAPFFEAARRRELVVQRCRGCRTLRFPARDRCSGCLAREAEWVPVSGRGTVFSFAVMHQVYHPGFAGEVPYAVVLVALDEGPRLVSNVVGCPPAELRVGMPLEVVFEAVTPEVTLPKFRVAGR